MNATPVSKEPNREAIRMLVADVGYTEASARSGLKRDRLYKWGQRYGWKTPITHAQGIVQTVQSPGDSHAEALAEMESETRISLSRYARKAAGAINKSVHPAKWTKEAHDIAKTAGLLHGWGNEKGQAGFSLNVLNLGQLQIGVQTDSTQDA